MEETKFEVLKDRENINKDLEEEMPPKETNENLVEHSLVSEASEKENKTETSEKEESTVNDSDSALVTIVTDEKCLRDAETEDKKQNLESDDLGKKLECTSESMAEDQSNKPLPEISQTQIEEDNDEGRDQTIDPNANESTKDVILTEKVPEGSEKGDENENIKEQIIQKESATKELHTVSSIDEADIEGKNSDPVSIDNLKPTDSNEQIETMNLEVEEDLDREQEASPLTKASEKETMEQVGKEKTADVSISVSEVSEEKIKEEIKEQADNCYDKLETASVNTVTKEKSLGEPQPDDKWGKALNNSFQEASNDEAILDLGCSNKITDDYPQLIHSMKTFY
ncbi:hypothetical protein L1049_002602 [Liquidambar formosana]|uniref:Uncharacterized protein n=1 Tax=Liquidambar formosana TaxID=63359 RepID=A0AAP0NHF1_LIQFO